MIILIMINCDVKPSAFTYLDRTMDTASLRILSPNTNMLSSGGTSRALNMARVATGSTAEMSAPNAKLSTRSNSNATSA